MNITLSGTKVSMDGHTLAFQKNNLVDSMVITVDTDETWQYKLDVKYPCKDSDGEELYNVIDLTRVGNTCTAILQASMLPFNGKYTMQLRGISGDKVYHTDTFDVWVKYSIDPSKVYDPVPSEFYQIEQAVTEQAANAKQSEIESAESATKAENAAVHSPIVGENGNWFIWDFEKSEYVDSGKPASIGGGADPSLGITGAQVGQIAKITAVDTDGKPTKWEPVDIPSGGDLSLGLTAATVGQTVKVKAVDTDGKPTAWKAADAVGGETWELIASGEMQEAALLDITKGNNGLPFSLKSAQIFVRGDISITNSSCMSVSARRWVSSKDYDAYSTEVFFGKENPKVNLWYVLCAKTVPMLFWEEAGIDWQSADCKVLMGAHANLIDGKVVRNKDILGHLINRVIIGAVMGNGNMAAGCKYEIWGVRA